MTAMFLELKKSNKLYNDVSRVNVSVPERRTFNLPLAAQRH